MTEHDEVLARVRALVEAMAALDGLDLASVGEVMAMATWPLADRLAQIDAWEGHIRAFDTGRTTVLDRPPDARAYVTRGQWRGLPHAPRGIDPDDNPCRARFLRPDHDRAPVDADRLDDRRRLDRAIQDVEGLRQPTIQIVIRTLQAHGVSPRLRRDVIQGILREMSVDTNDRRKVSRRKRGYASRGGAYHAR